MEIQTNIKAGPADQGEELGKIIKMALDVY